MNELVLSSVHSQTNRMDQLLLLILAMTLAIDPTLIARLQVYSLLFLAWTYLAVFLFQAKHLLQAQECQNLDQS